MKVRICKDEQAVKEGTGKVFDIDVSIPDLADVYTAEQVDAWTEYGFRVWLQKDVGEKNKKAFGGRDFTLVITELDAKGIPYTVTDWVKGEKAIPSEGKAILAMFKGMSKAQIEELLETYKAAKAG